MPTYEEHIRFVMSKPYSQWYIIYHNVKKSGSGYLSKQNEISIFVKKEFHGKGIGRKVLELIIEKELRDLQKKRFGYEGDLFKERQKLVKPIQDKVYNAVQKMAAARAYDFILDKSEGITIIFADPKLDKSDDVLKELGINN